MLSIVDVTKISIHNSPKNVKFRLRKILYRYTSISLGLIVKLESGHLKAITYCVQDIKFSERVKFYHFAIKTSMKQNQYG